MKVYQMRPELARQRTMKASNSTFPTTIRRRSTIDSQPIGDAPSSLVPSHYSRRSTVSSDYHPIRDGQSVTSSIVPSNAAAMRARGRQPQRLLPPPPSPPRKPHELLPIKRVVPGSIQQEDDLNSISTGSFSSPQEMDQYLNTVLNCVARNDPYTKTVSLVGYTLEQEVIVFLAMSLASNTQVKSLDLLDCDISDLEADLIAFVLRHNSSITELWLNGNNISDEGAEAIASGLCENNTLKILGLGDNLIGNAGVQAINEAMKHNKSITNVFLEGNRMNKEDFTQVICFQSGKPVIAAESLVIQDNLRNSNRRIAAKKQNDEMSAKSTQKLPSLQRRGVRRGTGKQNRVAATSA